MTRPIVLYQPARLLRRISAPALIFWATAAILLLGAAALCAWVATGRFDWVRYFFDFPGALFLVSLNALELSFSLVARRQFTQGEPLRFAWTMIVLAAACHLAGGILIQILSADAYPNPIAQMWPPDQLRRLGLTIAGPVQTALLASGLACALRACRRSGIVPRLRVSDWILVALVSAFTLRQLYGVAVTLQSGRLVTALEVVRWVNDPLLSLLLIEAIRMRRWVLHLGGGLIAHCWGALAAAVFLTSVGDLGLSTGANGYVQWPLTATTWYVWFLAGAAFALAPAYQVEAARRAARASAAAPDAASYRRTAA